MKKPSETQLVKACLQWLHVYGYFAYRSNSGAFALGDGKSSRFVRFGVKGLADITGILHDGRALYVECKMLGKKLTLDQRSFRLQVESTGGVYLLVYSVDELAAMLGQMA